MVDLLWTKWHWGRLSPNTPVSTNRCALEYHDHHAGLLNRPSSNQRIRWTHSHPTPRMNNKVKTPVCAVGETLVDLE
jgi:hypothetical protein